MYIVENLALSVCWQVIFLVSTVEAACITHTHTFMSAWLACWLLEHLLMRSVLSTAERVLLITFIYCSNEQTVRMCSDSKLQ